jgi:hypothetical protein
MALAGASGSYEQPHGARFSVKMLPPAGADYIQQRRAPAHCSELAAAPESYGQQKNAGRSAFQFSNR